MAVERADNRCRIAIADILALFRYDYSRQQGDLFSLSRLVENSYGPVLVRDVKQLRRLCSADRLTMKRSNQFIWLEPITRHKMVPLLTLSSSNGWQEFSVYVLLSMLEGSELRGLAVRFETDSSVPNEDGLPGAHDFCHAQLCQSIEGLIPPRTPEWLPVSQPSIPMDADDQITVVLCMLVSLYGGRHVLTRLLPSGTRDLAPHARRLRALQAIDEQRRRG